MTFQEFLTEQNITTIVTVVVGLCSIASGALEAMGKTTASKIIGGLPTAIDLGGILRWLARGKAKAKDAAVMSAGAGIVLAMLSGCAGTFEEARLARPSQPAPVSAVEAVAAAQAASARCEKLSDREYWFGLGAEAFGATGAGAIVTAIPVKSERGETALMIAGASAAAVAAVSVWASREAGSTYVQEGCAK